MRVESTAVRLGPPRASNYCVCADYDRGGGEPNRAIAKIAIARQRVGGGISDTGLTLIEVVRVRVLRVHRRVVHI
jgi:hypothetical protein